MNTVDDLINILNKYKEYYPEFDKYNICINVANDDDIYPKLKDVCLYINSDIGQVEFFAKTND